MRGTLKALIGLALRILPRSTRSYTEEKNLVSKLRGTPCPPWFLFLRSPVPSPQSPVPFIHLQWFSDEAEAEGRTEQPTEHKLRRLREEGQVPKSQELVGAVTLFLPALMLLFMAPSMLRTCVEMLRFFFSRATELDPTKDAIIVGVFFSYLVRLVLPILIVAVFAALFSNIVQVGFLFTTKPITPDFTKVLPRFGQFFKRIFSIDGLFNFGKSIIKMLIIGGVAFLLIKMDINKLANLQKDGSLAGAGDGGFACHTHTAYLRGFAADTVYSRPYVPALALPGTEQNVPAGNERRNENV